MAQMLAIRNTLVLGIGTTGKQVAESVANYLTWQFGGLEKAQWVRLLVMETAQEASILGDRVIHVGIKNEEFRPYIDAPRNAGSEFGFDEWQDGTLLRPVPVPEHGAGNLRMMGRLCLFHRPNYEKLRRRVTGDIDELKKLTNAQILEGLGRSDARIKRKQDEVVVYVVGTLCGGTCSGGAADLGYLLNVWSGGAVKRQAIFTVPHPGYADRQAARHKKNAFYALKELNHYQLADTVWTQKLPGNPDPQRIQGIPYEIIRVMMPATASTNNIKNLNTMIGQYLAAAAGAAGDVIEAADSNALSKMTSNESIGYMRPLFSTMGIASLEIPGELILSAMSERLLDYALTEWTRDDQGFQLDEADRKVLGPLSFEALLKTFVESYNNRTLDEFEQHFTPLRTNKNPTLRGEELTDLLGQLNKQLISLAGDAPLYNELNLGHNAMLPLITQGTPQFIQERLTRREYGPAFLARVLQEHLNERNNWVEQANQALPRKRQQVNFMLGTLNDKITTLSSLQTKIPEGQAYIQLLEANQVQATNEIDKLKRSIAGLETQISQNQKSIAEKRSKFMGQFKKTTVEEQQISELTAKLTETQNELLSVQQNLGQIQTALGNTQQALASNQQNLTKTWKDIHEHLPLYLREAIETEALTHIVREQFLAAQASAYRKVAEPLARRLLRLKTMSDITRDAYAESWKKKASEDPLVNGKAYFEAGVVNGTVAKTYLRRLTQPPWNNETEAQQHVLTVLAPLGSELVRLDSIGRFDPPVGTPYAQSPLPSEAVKALEDQAHGVFEDARSEMHVENRVKDSVEIDDLVQNSLPGLIVSEVQVSDQLSDTRGEPPQPQNIALMDLGENGAGTPNTETIQTMLLNDLPLERNSLNNSYDPFRLLLIQERHGFTFGQMKGVVRRDAGDLEALHSAEHCNDFSFWHTRRDVNWVDPLVPPTELQTTEEWWLKTVLMGRPKDSVLEWTPADRGEISEEGWYRTEGGEFHVYYVKGITGNRKGEQSLPRDFNIAIAKLMTPEYTDLKASLDVHFVKYCDDVSEALKLQAQTAQSGPMSGAAEEIPVSARRKTGFDRAVEVLDAGLDAIGILGLTGLDKSKAETILKRAYRRNMDMLDAYFYFCVQNQDPQKGTFQRLWRDKGRPLPGKEGGPAPVDAYYCPQGHLLGKEKEALRQARFQCPTCGDTGDRRYWP